MPVKIWLPETIIFRRNAAPTASGTVVIRPSVNLPGWGVIITGPVIKYGGQQAFDLYRGLRYVPTFINDTPENRK